MISDARTNNFFIFQLSAVHPGGLISRVFLERVSPLTFSRPNLLSGRERCLWLFNASAEANSPRRGAPSSCLRCPTAGVIFWLCFGFQHFFPQTLREVENCLYDILLSVAEPSKAAVKNGAVTCAYVLFFPAFMFVSYGEDLSRCSDHMYPHRF